MTEKTFIEWFQHPMIEALDDYVKEYMDRDCIRSWDMIGGSRCLEDFKYEADKWVQQRIEVLQELQEMIGELPDEQYKEYTISEDGFVEGIEDE